MDNPIKHHNIKAVSGYRGVNLFYSFVLSLVALTALADTASAVPMRNGSCALSSPNFINARAAIVVDPKGSVIYAKNQDLRLPPASTTKLLTAMVALDKLAPESKVKINRSAIKPHSAPPRLRADEELTVSDLLHLALMKSVNSAAAALAEGVAGSEQEFVELMNKKALDIGAINTKFANASGLPEGVQYTTVYDLTLILGEALKYPMIKEILGKKEFLVVTGGGRRIRIRSTDRLLWAKDNMIGGKTGYTRDAQHCFVGAFQCPEGTILTAVLGTRSRNRLWKSTELLYTLGSGPQSIPAIRQANESDGQVVSVVSDNEGKKSSVRHKKGRKSRHASNQKDEGTIKLVRKY